MEIGIIPRHPPPPPPPPPGTERPIRKAPYACFELTFHSCIVKVSYKKIYLFQCYPKTHHG